MDGLDRMRRATSIVTRCVLAGCTLLAATSASSLEPQFARALRPVAAPSAGSDRATDMRTESRPVSDFDRIVFAAPGELAIEQTDHESLTIEAEASVLPKLETRVVDHVLRIEAVAPFTTRLPIRYRLALRRLSDLALLGSGSVSIGPLRSDALRVSASGSGDLEVAQLQATRLDLSMSGSAHIELRGGSVDTQRVVIDGSGSYYAPHLASSKASASVSGSGDAVLAVSRTLDASIAGSGSIGYAGRPEVRRTIAGSGNVERISD
jgi:hypothetical protein